MDILTLGLFSFGGGPSLPAVQAAPQPPSINSAEVEDAKRKERELARKRKGRSGTILTGPSGIADAPKAKATLLGG